MKKFNHHHQQQSKLAFPVVALNATSGSIWPPRSYPCSFCKREFKSAQALGGHMNVHRRDRALLKQVIINNPNNPSNPNNTSNPNNKNNSIYNYSKNFSKSIVPQNNSFHVTSPRKSFVTSYYSQRSYNYFVTAKKVGEHVKESNFRGGRNDECLSYKRCKTIKHSNVVKDSKSMDDLDLELRLGNYLSQKVK